MKIFLKIIQLISLMIILGCTKEIEQSKYGYNLELQNLLNSSDLRAEEFKIDNSKDTTLFGNKGTVISIPKDCFKDVIGPVKIELIESFKLSDIVLLNAQTVSNGQILQTDGVVYVNATANGFIRL